MDGGAVRTEPEAICENLQRRDWLALAAADDGDGEGEKTSSLSYFSDYF